MVGAETNQCKVSATKLQTGPQGVNHGATAAARHALLIDTKAAESGAAALVSGALFAKIIYQQPLAKAQQRTTAPSK